MWWAICAVLVLCMCMIVALAYLVHVCVFLFSVKGIEKHLFNLAYN